MEPTTSPIKVAWISNFPVEWLSDIPESLRSLPREHPATWEMVLLSEFERDPSLQLHIIILRKNISRSFSFQRNGVTFHLLKYRGGTRASTLFWADTLLIRRALRQIKPDLVHAWGSEQGAALVASRLPYPYLVTVLGLLQWYKDVGPMPAYHKFGAWIEKISLPRAKHVSTESRFAVRYLHDNYPRLTIHQIEHAPNWVFHQVQRQPMSGPIRFLTNGAISHRKGTDLFLMALNELVPEFRFEATVIGSPNEPFIAPILAVLSPELRQRISFKSDLTAAEVARELSVATILLLPTRADTSPNAVKEAVVAGVPVVAGNVGGIPDYVIPGENGFLFAPGDNGEFVAAIRAALSHPLFSRGLVTPASLEKSREYLSPARMAQSFFSAYQSVKTR
jgi:glycosyltransferase involved in cell wall biosynthesis